MDSGVIEITAQLTGSLEGLKEELLRLGRGKIASTVDAVYYLLVERTGSKGEPLAYTIIEFNKNGIIIRYSLSDEATYFRKWEALKLAFPIISIASKYYNLDQSVMVELIDSLLDDIKHLVKNDVKLVERENAKLKIKLRRLEDRLRMCNKEKKELLEKIYLKERELEELKAKVRKYEVISDDVLREKIIEWLKDNGGIIDIPQFSKFYGVPESRVEEAIHQLIQEGYIKPL